MSGRRAGEPQAVVEEMIGAGRSSMAWMFLVLDRTVCATTAWLRN